MTATRVVYVAGVGFSGSTLLSFLANAHPQLVSIGEVTGPLAGSPAEYPCSCGAPVRACPFFARVGERLRAQGLAFNPLAWETAFEIGGDRISRHLLVRSLRNNRLDDLRDAIVARVPPYASQMEALLARNRAFVAAVCEVSRRPVLVDASKHPIRARFLQRAGLDVYLVHLVRDAPGFVASRRRNEGRALAAAVRHWRRGAAQVERVRARFAPERFLRLRYEDVCDDPLAALNAIAALAQLSPLAALDAKLAGSGVHVIGNRMRIGFSGRIERDERWRTLLTEAEIAWVLARTRDLRERFGYGA